MNLTPKWEIGNEFLFSFNEKFKDRLSYQIKVYEEEHLIVITLNCQARAGVKRNEFSLLSTGEVKVSIRAKRVEGEANRAICSFFAEILGLSQSKVSILKGELGKSKVISLQYYLHNRENLKYYLQMLQPLEKIISNSVK